MYDSLLFGNGLTLNLFSQLKSLIPSEKHYLLNIDDFLKRIADNQMTGPEEKTFYSFFYGGNDDHRLTYYPKLKKELANYYTSRTGDIEYHLGADVYRPTNCGYDFEVVKSLFPMLYNSWYLILESYLLSSRKLSIAIDNYVKSIRVILEPNPEILTINFDQYFDSLGLNTRHIHGTFADNLINLVIDKNEKNIFYKCIWGYTGWGKAELISSYYKKETCRPHFDFSFFFSDMNLGNMLIYGIGFRKAGFADLMSETFNSYLEPQHGCIIDEHILFRLEVLQRTGKIGSLTFAYYSDDDLMRYKKLSSMFRLENVSYKKTTDFNFSISSIS